MPRAQSGHFFLPVPWGGPSELSALPWLSDILPSLAQMRAGVIHPVCLHTDPLGSSWP